MGYDALDAGIEPGGLRDSHEIKILICYLLEHAGRPLTFDHLNEIVQKDGLVNYFEFGQNLHELLLSGHVDLIEQEGTNYYKVTKLGKVTAATFERNLPLSVREKAVNAAVRLLERLRLESENKVTITQGKNGYTVECRALDGNDELFALRLLVPEKEQAQAIRRQFLKNPSLLYRGVLALVTGDAGAVGGMIADEEDGHKQ